MIEGLLHESTTLRSLRSRDFFFTHLVCDSIVVIECKGKKFVGLLWQGVFKVLVGAFSQVDLCRADSGLFADKAKDKIFCPI